MSVCKQWQSKNQMCFGNINLLVNKYSELRSVLQSLETQTDLSLQQLIL